MITEDGKLQMDEDMFERLPEAMKQEILEKRRLAAEKEAKLAREREERLRYSCFGAALATLAAGAIAPLPWFYPLLSALGGGAGAWLIVQLKLSTLAGIGVFGANAVVCTLLSYSMSGSAYRAGFTVAILFGSWLFQLGIGFAVAAHAESVRRRQGF